MKDIHTLNRLEQLKALSDPLRLRVLEAFSRQPVTTKQVAALLGENATKLYHHVQILEEAGLVHLVKTRKNRGTLEKYYQAIARDFIVDRNLRSGPGDQGLPVALSERPGGYAGGGAKERRGRAHQVDQGRAQRSRLPPSLLWP